MTMVDSPTASITPPPAGWRRHWRPGWVALRRLWRPFALIQFCGLLVVLGYFYWPAMRDVCDRLAKWKQQGGWIRAALFWTFTASLLPEAFKQITGVERHWNRQRRRLVTLNFFLFFVEGFTVNALYTTLNWAFGPAHTPGTVAVKVFMDQFVFTPVIGLPWIALGYTWFELGWRPAAWRGKLGRPWYVDRVIPLLLPCWAYWIPMTALMFCLPINLTYVMGACASAAGAMILVAVAHDGAAGDGASDPSRV